MWYSQVVAETLNLPLEHVSKISKWIFDSRQACAGCLYVALKGEKVDGHLYLEEALKKGATFALVDQKYTKEHPGLTLIRVQNVLNTLQFLAHKVIQFWRPKVIAITGSIGKTSTKEFIYTLLHKTHSVYKTPGNFNSQLTLPLTILNAPKRTEYLLLEMGMDQPGELQRLIQIAPPHFAILTQLAHVHVEAFGTFDRLADEKLKIFDHKETQWALFHKEMPFSDRALKRGKAKKIICSTQDPEANYFLEEKKNGLTLFKNKKILLEFQHPLDDPKSLINLLLALALADTLNVPKSTLQKQVQEITYPEKRMVCTSHQGVLYLDDAYNSCVESVENALLSLPKHRGRKIAILGAMVDQGQYEEKNHRKIASLAMEHVDILLGFGSEMEAMKPIWKNSGKKWALFTTYPLLCAYVSKLVKKNDTVLIKGSRKFALERLIGDLTTR